MLNQLLAISLRLPPAPARGAIDDASQHAILALLGPDAASHADPGLLDRLADAPWIGVAALGVAVVIGLLFWSAGRKVLKPLTVAMCVTAGVIIGKAVFPNTIFAGEAPDYWGLLIGGAFGAVAGLLVYRSALALGFGLVLAAALPLLAAVTLPPVATPPPSALAAADQFLPDVRIEHADQSADDDALALLEGGPADADLTQLRRQNAFSEEALRAGLDRVMSSLHAATPAADSQPADSPEPEAAPADPSPQDRAEAIASAAWNELTAAWDAQPKDRQLIYASLALAGLLIGALIGLFLPEWSASLVTSSFGAGVWLPAAASLWTGFDMPGAQHLRQPMATWLLIWCGVSLLGFVVQVSSLARRRRTRGSPAPD